jgi:hypothetical protein
VRYGYVVFVAVATKMARNETLNVLWANPTGTNIIIDFQISMFDNLQSNTLGNSTFHCIQIDFLILKAFTSFPLLVDGYQCVIVADYC